MHSTPFRARIRRLPVLGLLAAASCGTGDGGGAGFATRDSAGVTIAEGRGAPAEWRLEEQPAVRIGLVEGEPAYQFHLIRFVGRLADDRLVVVDGGSREIRYFDATGQHLASVGRPGAGPDEFSAITSAALGSGDSLFIHDSRNQRISVLAPEAFIARSQTFRVAGSTARVLGVAADGSVLAALESQPRVPATTGFTFAQDTIVLASIRVGTAAVDTIVAFTGLDRADWRDDAGGTRFMNGPMPFGHRPAYAASGADAIVTWEGGTAVAMISRQAGLRRIIRRSDLPPAPASPTERARYLDHVAERAAPRGDAAVAEARSAASDQLAVIPQDHRVPAFDRILAGAEGLIWARHFQPISAADEPQRWTVFAADGRPLAEVRIPARLTVMHVTGNSVSGVERDEFDVEHAVSYRITR
jgi:hypothetical protein